MRNGFYSFLLVTICLSLYSCKNEEEQPKQSTGILSITGIELVQLSKDKSAKSSAQYTWEHIFEKSLKLVIRDVESGQVYQIEVDPNDFSKTYSRELPYGTYTITNMPSRAVFTYELPLLVDDRVTLNQSNQSITLKAQSEFGLFTVYDQNIITAPITVSDYPKELRKQDEFYYIYWIGGKDLTLEFKTSAGQSFRQHWSTIAFEHKHLSIQKPSENEENATFLQTDFNISQSVIQINEVGVPIALSPDFIGDLDPSISESSGLAVIKARLFSVNDGGNTNEVFELDPKTGQTLRAIEISNAANVDWEDLAVSEKHIFIGDFGNNSGKRHDLTVYKTAISELLTSAKANSEKISFQFSDQEDFNAYPNNTNFDCEAMVFYGGNLHLFTKNWKDSKTKHYTLSPTSGNQIAKLEGIFDSKGLITGASITADGKLALLGYENKGISSRSFVWLFTNLKEVEQAGKGHQIFLGSPATLSQTEGIDFISEDKILISGEEIKTGGLNVKPKLHSLNLYGIL